MKVAVMGAGAIGSLFGGLLAESGTDVTLIAREAHVNAIKQNGLIIDGVSGKRVVNVKAVTSVMELSETFDLILLTVKAYDTAQAVAEAKPLFRRNSVLFCLQNGLGVEKIASDSIGSTMILRGVTSNGALVKKPGLVMHTGKGQTVIGEPYCKIIEKTLIAETFQEAGLPTRSSGNIEGDVWTKVLVNAGINPFGALTAMTNGELIARSDLKELMTETVIEGKKVAGKFNTRLDEDPVSLMINIAEMTAQNKNSMLQDIEKGKRTEIDFINGAISCLGKTKNVSTPLNTLLTGLIKGLEVKHLRNQC
ncbi:MAG: 2-dehydropantoate 2-reductase [Candidatus Bathyarchaeota archaeon]|nr:MAG: 2-dehydropantoate 2-reductase [Candidatus Bathyarchaeota archaeon]